VKNNLINELIMKRHVNTYIYPGKIFQDMILTPLKLITKEASEKLCVSQEHSVKFVNGEMGITPQIAREFGGRADFWIRMQETYDAEMT
jgi:antitoxin HigA-1